MLGPLLKAAAWWAPEWLALAGLHSLTFDSNKAHWLTLWMFSLGYVAMPFWLGWWAPSMALRPPPKWARGISSAALTGLWLLI